MGYANHHEHFLERLSRIDDEQAAYAMSLYYDAEFVRGLLKIIEIPPQFDRVAVAINAEGRAPYVVLSRDGGFVTCLGEQMKPTGLHILRREEVDSHAGLRDAAKESARRMEEEGWSPNSPWALFRRKNLLVSREDFVRLDAVRPILVLGAMDDLFVLPNRLEDTRKILSVRLGRKIKKFNRQQEEMVHSYWMDFFLMHHLSVSLAMEVDDLAIHMPLKTLDILFGDLPWWSWREGMNGPCTRALWCAGQMGGVLGEHFLERLRKACTLHRFMMWFLAMIVVCYRHPRHREPFLALLNEWQEAYPVDTDGSPIVPDERPAEIAPERALADALGAVRGGWATYGIIALQQPEVISRLFLDQIKGGERSRLQESGTPEDEIEAAIDEVTAMDFLKYFTFPVADIRDDFASYLLLANAAPAIARAEASDLYIPREEIAGLKGWDPKHGLLLFQNHAAAARVSRPVRTGDEPGRNAPCPCGSKRKYKRCCLA